MTSAIHRHVPPLGDSRTSWNTAFHTSVLRFVRTTIRFGRRSPGCIGRRNSLWPAYSRRGPDTMILLCVSCPDFEINKVKNCKAAHNDGALKKTSDINLYSKGCLQSWETGDRHISVRGFYGTILQVYNDEAVKRLRPTCFSANSSKSPLRFCVCSPKHTWCVRHS